MKWNFLTGFILLQPILTFAGSKPIIGLDPIGQSSVIIPSNGASIVKYTLTNNSKKHMQMTMRAADGISQLTSSEFCQSPINLASNASCTLAVLVDLDYISSYGFVNGPIICKNKNSNYVCNQPSRINLLKVSALTTNFPYGSSPSGNLGIGSSSQTTGPFATPETMLGSWAMIQAVSLDKTNNVLPSFMNENNTVYAVGTAAIGNLLGLADCSDGCNALNGYCFALKFTEKSNYPYMVFQSVNIGAATNSFDIYLPGGGYGVNPDYCAQFWSTNDAYVDWGKHINDYSSCNAYFNNFNFTSNYSVTYDNVTHNALQTLKNACTFAYNTTGFSTSNFNNVKIVPVTCPTSLTQITGVRLDGSATTVGNQPIKSLGTLTAENLDSTTIAPVITTQMQDCKPPSSSYTGNVQHTVTNYDASISTTMDDPVLTSTTPSGNYCQLNPSASGFCSWNNGTTWGSDYCNTSQNFCLGDCNEDPATPSKWCTCSNGQVVSCNS